jgi:dolichol-phosphate mannosyltransferase
MVFVNDGGSDGSPQVSGKVAPHDPHVCAVHLSRNFGHHPASTAA